MSDGREMEIREKFRNMDDHDLLIESATTLSQIKEQLEQMNGTVRYHDRMIAQHSTLWKIFGASIMIIAGVLGFVIDKVI